MSSLKRSRGRAVRLTPSALERLKGSLFEAHQVANASGKLTREARAKLLGVSVVTAERILSREGVDRPTLLLAFSRLGLAWEDICCERVIPDVALNEEAASPPPPLQALRKPINRLVVGGFLLTVLLIAAWQRVSQVRTVASDAWRPGLAKVLADGSTNYHQGNFEKAQLQFAKAIALAREYRAEGHLSSALRMDGDLAVAQGSFSLAKARYEEALALRTAFQEDCSEPAILEALGDLETKTGDFAAAKMHLSRSLAMFQSYKDNVGVAMACRDLGSLALQTGDLKSASTWFQSSLRAVKGLSKPDIETDVKGREALVMREQGRFDEARSQLQVCLEYWLKRDHPRWIAVTQFQLGTVEAMGGNRGAALALFVRGKQGFQDVGDRAGVADVTRWIEKIEPKPREVRSARK